MGKLLGRFSQHILNLGPKNAMHGFAIPRADKRKKMRVSLTQLPSRETLPRTKRKHKVFKRRKTNEVGHDTEMRVAFCKRSTKRGFAKMMQSERSGRILLYSLLGDFDRNPHAKSDRKNLNLCHCLAET